MEVYEIRLLATRLQHIHDDLADTSVPDSYAGMVSAGLFFLNDISTALYNYTDNDRMHRDLITAAMDFTQRWETWIGQIKPEDLKHPASKAFHEMLLRLSKGAVKAYRIWRIDKCK
jgi:hypothetical protein